MARYYLVVLGHRTTSEQHRRIVQRNTRRAAEARARAFLRDSQHLEDTRDFWAKVYKSTEAEYEAQVYEDRHGGIAGLGRCVQYGCEAWAVVVERSDDCPENPLCQEHQTRCPDLVVRRSFQDKEAGRTE